MANPWEEEYEAGPWDDYQDEPAVGDVTAQSYSGPVIEPKSQLTQARQEMFQEEPWYNKVLAGMGKTFKSTLVNPVSQAGQYYFGDEGDYEKRVGEHKAEMESFEDAAGGDPFSAGGEISADLLMALAPASVASKGTQAAKVGNVAKSFLTGGAVGATSATQHQLQNIGEGEDISPLEFGAETAISSVLPGAGKLVGNKLKQGAEGILRSAVKPAQKFRTGRNPVKFDVPLDKKVVPLIGGLEKTSENASKVIKKAAEKRDALVDNAKIKVNISTALKDARASIQKQMDDGILDVEEGEEALKYFTGALKNTQKRNPTIVDGVEVFVAGPDAVKLRKLADKGTKWNKMVHGDAPPPKSIWNEAYRNAIENQMDSRLTKGIGSGTVSKKIGEEAIKLKKEMAEMIPFKNAVDHRLSQEGNNFKLGLLDIGSLGAGGAVGGPVGALGLAGLRRVTSKPGGARLVYEAGKFGEGPLSKRASLGLSQASRSAADYYMDDINK